MLSLEQGHGQFGTIEFLGSTEQSSDTNRGIDGGHDIQETQANTFLTIDNPEAVEDAFAVTGTDEEVIPEYKKSELEKEKKIDDLRDKLQRHNIPVDQWGQGEARTIEHFLGEVERGETELLEGEDSMTRRIKSIYLKIFHGDKELYEEKQVFKDGRERVRQDVDGLREKRKPGEKPEKTAMRSILEELQIHSFRDILALRRNLKPLQAKPVIKKMDSPSYPGLPTEYEIREFSTTMPDTGYKDQYITEEEEQTSYFSWKNRNENSHQM